MSGHDLWPDLDAGHVACSERPSPLTPLGRRSHQHLQAAGARRLPAPRPLPRRTCQDCSCCSRWSGSSRRNAGQGRCGTRRWGRWRDRRCRSHAGRCQTAVSLILRVADACMRCRPSRTGQGTTPGYGRPASHQRRHLCSRANRATRGSEAPAQASGCQPAILHMKAYFPSSTPMIRLPWMVPSEPV